MFRHHGKSRTLIHNLMLASLLSFVAVIVNVLAVALVYDSVKLRLVNFKRKYLR